MGDGPNQPDLSRLGTQTSVLTSLSVCLSEFPGGPQDSTHSSVTRPAPSPGFKPGLGRGPTPSIPRPFRFLGSGLDVGSLRAGRPVPSRFSLSAVSTSEQCAPLTHQGEGTGLPALSSWGNRYGLPPPLRVLSPPLGSQSFAPPPPHVTLDMGTHAGLGFPGVAPHSVLPENPSLRGVILLGTHPQRTHPFGELFSWEPTPREPIPLWELFSGELTPPFCGGCVGYALFEPSRPRVHGLLLQDSVTLATPGPLGCSIWVYPFLGYLQIDPAGGGVPMRLAVSKEPVVGPHVGSQPSVPLVPPVTSQWGLSLGLPHGSPPMGLSPQTVPLIILYTGIESAVGSPHVATGDRLVPSMHTPPPAYPGTGRFQGASRRRVPSQCPPPPPLLSSQYGSSGVWGLHDLSPVLSLLPSCRAPLGFPSWD